MSRTLRRLVGLTGAALLVAVPSLPSQAADAPIQTVRGYVVGQPTASDRVVTTDVPSDYAIGQQVDVTGALESCSSHAGMTGTSTIVATGASVP